MVQLPQLQRKKVAIVESTKPHKMAEKFLAEGEFDKVQAPLARKSYAHMQSLAGVFKLNGYSESDIVPHRLMVTALDHCLEDWKKARAVAEKKRQYSEAEKITHRIAQAKKDFRSKQQWQVKEQQRQEVIQMDVATKIMKTSFKEYWDRKYEDTTHENAKREELLEEKQARDRRELEKKIAKLPPPVASMSKELVGYVTMEEHMRKNGQYYDAEILNKKIQKLAPLEQKNAEKTFYENIDKMRQKLDTLHEEERKTLFETSKAHLIKIRDGRIVAAKVNKQAMTMHSEALNHALALEMIQPAGWKRTIKPTVEKRKHYDQTTSAKRGTQVLASVSHARLDAPQLCSTHDFQTEPGCMITYDEYSLSHLVGGRKATTFTPR